MGRVSPEGTQGPLGQYVMTLCRKGGLPAAAHDHQWQRGSNNNGYDCDQWSKPPNTDGEGPASHREQKQLQGTVSRLQ